MSFHPQKDRQVCFWKCFQIPTEFLRFSLASLISELLKSTLANQKYSGEEHLTCAQYVLNAMKLFFKLSLDSGLIKQWFSDLFSSRLILSVLGWILCSYYDLGNYRALMVNPTDTRRKPPTQIMAILKQALFLCTAEPNQQLSPPKAGFYEASQEPISQALYIGQNDRVGGFCM